MEPKPIDIEEIFNTARRKRTVAERSAYLDEVCRDNPELRGRVEKLLKAHNAAGGFLEEPLGGVEVTLDDSPVTEGPGTKIGRYKLLELIGEGGFGVVYMAEQREPIRRRVALKIIKLGMDTKQVIARFEVERQALAMMEHPNIAKVLDAGATETGRPYFVMELVKGISITDYCDKNNLDTNDRLQLFIDVCKAVQHAHQKGIIHRDIKPSNVMITLHDGEPVPKIIDFGIAKATGQRLTEKTLFTRYAHMIGTPAYMSPEQAEMSALDVDTRSDIYSLGVLLYELLTGATPFDAQTLREAGYNEMQRIIREEEPDKPSTKLSSLGEALADIAKHRQVEAGQLSKIISGDLDWVVMRALEKDRTRRYETANGLARDIERHLGDEPVVAGPPSTVYRLRKFVRRNRTAVIFALSIAAVLVIGLCLATIGFIQASRQRNRAVLAETEAITQRDTAEQARGAEAQQRQRAEVNFQRARDAVDEMTKVTQERLADVPRMGQVRRQLLEKAQIFYQGFLEERSDDPAVRLEAGRALRRVGSIHLDLGENEQGEQACRNATDIFEKLAADYPDASEYQKEILACYQLLGEALEMLGRVQDAEQLYQRAVSIGERLVADYPDVGEYQGELTGHYHRLGALLRETDHLRESLEFYRKAVERQEKLTANFPDAANYQLELASYYAELASNLSWAAEDGIVSDRKKGFDEAEQAIRKSIRIIEEFVSARPDLPSHRAYLAYSYGVLSTVLADSDSGRLEEARQAADKQIGILEKLVDDFPYVLGHQNWLGRAWHNLHYDIAESLEEKEKVIRKAIAIREKMATNFPNVPETTDMVVESYDTLGDVLKEMGRLEEAEEAYQKAEEIEKEMRPMEKTL